MPTAPAGAANGVIVEVNGRDSVVLTQLEVASAAGPRVDSTTRAPDGSETDRPEGGTALLDIAQLAGYPADVVRAFEVPRDLIPGAVRVEAGELRNGFGGDNSGETRFATIDVDRGEGVRFFRPVRSDSDVNARDAVTTPKGVDLTVRLQTTNDALREVSASADDENPRPNAPVGFLADIESPPDGVDFTYRWDFGDGTTATGQAPSHGFAAGTYRVSVTIVGDDGSTGVSSPIPIQAGSAAAGATPTASPSPQPDAPGGDGSEPGGPGEGGPGRTGGGDGTPDDGATGPKQSDGEDGGGRKPSKDPDAKVRPEATATPTPAATTPAPGTTPKPEPEPGEDGERDEDQPPAATSGPQSIDGVLLAGAGDVAQLERLLESVTAAETSRPSPLRSGGGGGACALGWVGGGAAFFFLLGGGALRERRGSWV